MYIEYAEIHNVMSRIVICGTKLNSIYEHKEIVVIIPGNPGVTSYYEHFIKELHDRVQLPVIAICHAGHDISKDHDLPPTKEYPHLYDVQGQIKHKIEFLRKYIPDNVKIHFIGHSVGCYIILNILKDNLIKNEVIKSYLLFPAIERLGASPNGKRFQFFNSIFLWLILLLSTLFIYLPYVIGKYLVAGYFWLEGTHYKNIKPTMNLINPISLRNIFFMAQDEMDIIKELDVNTINKFHKKLFFYYGKLDGWAPYDYYQELVLKLPCVNAVADNTGMSHAFVLNHSIGMANVLKNLIKK